MSNISELANVPQISFIENMTLQETEEQLKAEYARIYREQTGKELVLGEADAKNPAAKSVCPDRVSDHAVRRRQGASRAFENQHRRASWTRWWRCWA